jgi:hypothetical protein
LKRLVAIVLVAIVAIALVLAAAELLPSLDLNINPPMSKDFHFGVSFGGNTSQDAKVLIDKVKGFTNLFVVQSGPVEGNETAMNEIVDYAVNSGLDVVAAFGFFNPNYTWQVPWLDYAKQTWDSHFLGVYIHDEPGGVTVDANWTDYFEQLSIRNSSNYREHQPAINMVMNGTLPLNDYELGQAAYHFVTGLQTDPDLNQLENRSILAFTSDYALYWFDYLGGYDTVFAEFGSNQSITQTIAMVRGAATMQNKTWGNIITWTYHQPPYLVNGSEMYSELVAGYTAGAKYEVIFDYPTITGNPYGILTEDQFDAMQKFWNNIPALRVDDQAEAVFVLPQNLGSGFRNPLDGIWGLWPTDNRSMLIYSNMQMLLSRYGSGLDVVYEDPHYPIERNYTQVYWWNQTL